jgi:hypothetical protein
MHVLRSRTLFMASSARLHVCAAFGALMLVAAGCDDRTQTSRVKEDFVVVPGTPRVETGAPEVKVDPTRHTDDFRLNTARQCDLFRQETVRKVDILWVVDSSGSMAPKQARLSSQLTNFIDELVKADPPIDFRIAVTTTDTDDPARRGKLLDWTLGSTGGKYIACTPNAAGTATTCSAGDGTTAAAVQAFQQLVGKVGDKGSPVERGLLNVYLVLENPENRDSQGAPGFIRPDAALYVVVLSDEDDSSCNPMAQQLPCTADPGCKCAGDGALASPGTYGSTTYFANYIETFKGYGNSDRVALAAIVALDAQNPVPSQFGDPQPHTGCCFRTNSGAACPQGGSNDGTMEIAYYGGRYIGVAAQTGGVAVNICDPNFSGALSALGYAASGLRRDFRLTRVPDLKLNNNLATGLDVFVSRANAANCAVDGNCPVNQVCRAGRCAEKWPVTTQVAPNGVRYLKCDASAYRNVVRFDGSAIPESLATVEVCYDVAPDFSTTCQ